MRKLLLVIFLVIFCGIFREANAQCIETPTDPCVPVKQSILDRTSKALDELQAARVLIAKYAAQAPLDATEREAYKRLSASWSEAFDARGKVIADMQTISDLKDKVIAMYGVLVEKLTAQLSKPKSAWQKFIGVVEKVVVLLAGVAVGRGF